MNGKKILGVSMIALALVGLSGLAGATSTAYDVPVGQTTLYTVPGVLLNPPTLSQSQGNAVIVSETFDSVHMLWDVNVKCVSSSAPDCTGFILS